MNVWALVPARGGSKSIPLKNLVPLAGVPLLDYGIRAAQASGSITKIICSTDDARIAARALSLGCEVDQRPQHLATDEAPVAEVARDLLHRIGHPDLLMLIQPTSPFLLPEHIRSVVRAIDSDPNARSAQTVTKCSHNHHAWNQREIVDGYVRFIFPAERAKAYNKQSKPQLFVFGNLVAVRSSALQSSKGFFPEPSIAIEIPVPYDFDLDGPGDLVVAEALIVTGTIRLPHMTKALQST